MQRIQEYVDKGFEVTIEKHYQMPGYSVCIAAASEETCPDCGQSAELMWGDAGHGVTIKEAITDAIALFNDEPRDPKPDSYYRKL